jgi:hypothetical protein
MATLDPFYDLFEFDSSETILGLKQTKTNDHLIITTTTTVAVFEILTRKGEFLDQAAGPYGKGYPRPP